MKMTIKKIPIQENRQSYEELSTKEMVSGLGKGLAEIIYSQEHGSPIERLERIRKHLDRVDFIILMTLAERLSLMKHVGEYKFYNNLSITDEKREIEIMEKRKRWGRKEGLSDQFTEEFFLSVMNESKRIMLEKIKQMYERKMKKAGSLENFESDRSNSY